MFIPSLSCTMFLAFFVKVWSNKTIAVRINNTAANKDVTTIAVRLNF